jgi:hypothetical protein
VRQTSNILLDANLEAKVSDFGTIREQKRGIHTNIANAETHMTTRVVIGTDSCTSLMLRLYTQVLTLVHATIPLLQTCRPSM